MLRNYIIVALRNLRRQRGYTLINICGLTIGLASSIFILLYVVNELTYDRFHEKSDRIYRIWVSGRMPATEMRSAVTASPMAQALLNDYPEVEQVVRLHKAGDWLVRRGDRVFHETEQDFIFADSSYFDVFSFRLLKGDPGTCLRDPRSIVLSETYARKYFGDEDPLGKTLEIEQDTNLSMVTGVMEDIPENSHFHCHMIGSLNTLAISRENVWVNTNIYTYVVLAEGTDPVAFEGRLHDMVVRYIGPLISQGMGIDLEQFEAMGHSYGYRVQKMTDIHLHSDLQHEIEPNGNPLYVYVFLVAAIMILAIAVVNFMNLATARSSIRAREVGLRKVAGSGRSQLIAQFITESVVLSFLSLVVAVILVYMLLPGFDNLIGLSLSFDMFRHSWIMPALILFGVVVGILAGSYPAFVLASFRPVAVLHSGRNITSRKSILRSLLVVMQFLVTIVILIGTFIVNRQLNYMQRKDPGFDRDHVMVISRSEVLGSQIDAFKEEIEQHSNIISAANSTHIPSFQYWGNSHWLEGWDRGDMFALSTSYVSYDYDRALGLELVEGRFFSRGIPSDSSAVVINEATVRALGLEDPLSNRFVEPSLSGGEDKFLPVIGVVKDFHYESMNQEIKPMAMHFMQWNREGVIVVRLGDGDMQETIEFVRQKWEAFNMEHPFEYTWLNEEYGKLFNTERRTSHILFIFSILSIFVTCLGLLGLVSYAASQRTREIGIRKVMGASVHGVIRLLSKETVKLLGISALLSIPAYFAVEAWLQNFAYHITFHAGTYFLVLAGVTLVVLVLALLTVSYITYRAATANPADSIRVE